MMSMPQVNLVGWPEGMTDMRSFRGRTKIVFLLVLFVCVIPLGSVVMAVAQTATAPQWEVFANCAAAYRANVQNRLTDPNRTPAMRDSIQEESDNYKLSATQYYAKDKNAAKDEADRNVSAHINANVARFIAMDKAGTLEAFIDNCPQLEEP
jgi:hypothetical protein